MEKVNKVKYKCCLCAKVYLEHDETYILEYPMASIDNRDAVWWEHYYRECVAYPKQTMHFNDIY